MTRWIPTLIALAVLVAGCGSHDKGSGPKDTTPPGRIVDLAGSLSNDSTVTLIWTAPGDDGPSGSADRYDLRWSTGFLTDGTWDSAPRCEGLPEPHEAGSGETHSVTDLPRSTPLRLALKAIDEAGNASEISSVVTVRLPPSTPACSLSVEGLAFGTIAPHETADRSFTITNVGGGRLHGEIAVQGDRFSVIEGAGVFDLGFRETRAATVRFTPGISGPAEGSVTFGLDGCGPIPCSGRGSGPYCVMDWDTLRFGDVYVGDHQEWRLNLTNRGDQWTVVTPQLQGCTGMRVPYDQSFTLQPGESRSLSVQFWPQVDGPVDCRLRLNAFGDCDEVTLLGRGIGPQCWQSADGRGFGPVPVGTTVDWPFTIENRGGGVLEGTVSGGDPDFTVTSGAGAYALHRGESRIVRVRFAPQSAGEKACTIETGSNACRDVSLWGTGLGAECVVEPDTLDFGVVGVGSTTEASFTITNRGLGTLTGSVPTHCGDFAVIDGWGSFSLAQNETKTCRARFQPLSRGLHGCVLPLGLACGDLMLQGSATGEFCRVEPAILDFGSVPAWSETEQSFTITNVGGGAWLTGRVSESCPRFTLVRGAGDFSIRPGATREVVLRFTPDLAGPYSCSIDLGTASCPTVSASGTAYGAICELTPSAVEFPPIRPRAHADTVIVVRNVGGGMLGGLAELSCPEFSLTAGGGSFLLAHGETHAMGIRWSPTAEGTASCVLRLGSICDSIPLSGTCVDVPPVCAVSADSLEWRLATVARSGQIRSFHIGNDGGRVLTGSVASTSEEFVVTEGSGDFELRAQEHRLVVVQFRPSAAGTRVGMITLGVPDCPGVICTGTGVSYQVLAELSNVDDEARLAFNGGGTRYTAHYGKLGTEETGWRDIGHYPGSSGTLDVTTDLVPGVNRVRCTLTNVRQAASVRLAVSRPGEQLIDAEYHAGSAPGGVVYDETFEVDLPIE